MTVRPGAGAEILLEGECPAEDAEALLGCILTQPHATVDWRHCDYAHTAVIQVLLASGLELRGPPRAAFLREVLEPAMIRSRRVRAVQVIAPTPAEIRVPWQP